MLEIFTSTPTWDNLDLNHIGLPRDGRVSRIMYKNRELMVLSGLHLDESGRLTITDVPKAFVAHLRKLGVELIPERPFFDLVLNLFDQHGTPLTYVSSKGLVEKMMDHWPCEGLLSLGQESDNDGSDDDSYLLDSGSESNSAHGDDNTEWRLRFCVDAIRFTTYTCPAQRAYNENAGKLNI